MDSLSEYLDRQERITALGYIRLGLMPMGTELWSCIKCGGAIDDVEKHEEYHRVWNKGIR